MESARLNPPRLAIVLPCYNEEACLQSSLERLLALLEEWASTQVVASDSFCCCVDDGSRDATWSIVERFASQTVRVRGIRLARNSGHQNALLAGMKKCRADCDCLVTIDADLQDDPGAIREMLEHFHQGSRIVFGVRRDRSTDSLFKRATAGLFYGLLRLLGAGIVPEHADFRLMDGRVLDCLDAYEERNLFLRGVVAAMGFRQSKVYYKRALREHGESKYPFLKMVAFAWEGITSFSIVPLRLIFLLGICFLMLSAALTIWILWVWAIGQTVPGWASLTLVVAIFGGCQFFAMGILGEYLGKIYAEAKGRPRYFIEDEQGWG